MNKREDDKHVRVRDEHVCVCVCVRERERERESFDVHSSATYASHMLH